MNMKPILLPAMLFFCAGSAFAQSPQSANTDTRDSSAATRDAADHYCLRETGSHLHRKSQDGRKLDCAGYGRVYTREDIERTGAANIADALRQLDPSVH